MSTLETTWVCLTMAHFLLYNFENEEKPTTDESHDSNILKSYHRYHSYGRRHGTLGVAEVAI